MASAQIGAAPFTGFYAGPAIGAVDHHFVLEENAGNGNLRRFNVTRWGIGGEVFAGYDLAVAPRVRLGAEAAVDFGGRAAVERNANYTLGIAPRHGFSLSVRAGYAATPFLLLYGGGGYGGHDYRKITSDTAQSAGFDRNRSFILRGGVEYAVTRAAHVRFEFQHLDGIRNQFMLGLPIRF